MHFVRFPVPVGQIQEDLGAADGVAESAGMALKPQVLVGFR